MTTFNFRRSTARELNELVRDAPVGVSLTDDHRRSLSARFRAVSSAGRRRLDAWSVEQAGQPSSGFHWTPATARRLLGNGAMRRMVRQSISPSEAVSDEIEDQLLRCASGYARAGSLAYWLASRSASEIALVSAEATNWAVQVHEIAQGLEREWRVAASDAFYDVASARTSLRARRDLEVPSIEGRVVLRVRSGSPGKSAGPGLRSDLTIDTLADPQGVAPRRFIGVWPEAGVMLSVDGTMDDLRAGARDLVRTAVVSERRRLQKAA
jgi:stage V sporulation protein SpoVS